ncbi:MAG: 5-(carboxyamino)imidazole ribonucleotide synthase [Bacteroidetes bacterium]|nr:MAG: 5-(carboxyamino)imidazole ribonucleotide synthase [Bacteroidota bacterium]
MRKPFIDQSYKLGILGGGQLGKMLCQSASRWGLHTHILDTSRDFPAGAVCDSFTEGNFKDFDDVVAFGQSMDAVTIEIESVNSDGLRALRDNGVIVHPSPESLDIIKDKGLQKAFYVEIGLPTASFELFDKKSEVQALVDSGKRNFPFVVKARRDGYDGRGVAMIRNQEDLDNCFDTPCLVEPLIDLELEISVVVARNIHGEIKSFPTVGMHFYPIANLVDYLYCPSGIGPSLESEAMQIAQAAIEGLDICGLLAVEMFVTSNGEILINEVAPRPHNSGHHTIEALSVSQFEQHIRGVVGLPLADPVLRSPAVMINILGSEGHTGDAIYQGITESLALGDVHIHLYGKQITKPFRKMGHSTILAPDLEQAIEKAKFVRDLIKVIS